MPLYYILKWHCINYDNLQFTCISIKNWNVNCFHKNLQYHCQIGPKVSSLSIFSGSNILYTCCSTSILYYTMHQSNKRRKKDFPLIVCFRFLPSNHSQTCLTDLNWDTFVWFGHSTSYVNTYRICHAHLVIINTRHNNYIFIYTLQSTIYLYNSSISINSVSILSNSGYLTQALKS